jgi:hypothetical protein
MEVIEIISNYIDKEQNLIIVEFKLLEDGDDQVREDFIEYNFFEEFGYDNNKLEILNTLIEEEDEWGDDEYDRINDETLISFLNEYYIVYPRKLPKPQIK